MTTTPQPESPGQADRRASILDAAARVFQAKGYSATTVDAIATEAGISKGSVYNYFSSKEDLFTKLCLGLIAQDRHDAAELLASDSPAGVKLEEFLDYWYRRREVYRELSGLVLEFWMSVARQDPDGTLAKPFHESGQFWLNCLSQILQQGRDSGEFAEWTDPEVGSRLVLAMMDGICLQALVEQVDSLSEQAYAVMKRGIFTVLGTTAPSGQPEPQTPSGKGVSDDE